MLWRLEQVDMEHVFRMVPGLRERILASFRSHLYHLMEENKQVYDTESWCGKKPRSWMLQINPGSSDLRNPRLHTAISCCAASQKQAVTNCEVGAGRLPAKAHQAPPSPSLSGQTSPSKLLQRGHAVDLLPVIRKLLCKDDLTSQDITHP